MPVRSFKPEHLKMDHLNQHYLEIVKCLFFWLVITLFNYFISVSERSKIMKYLFHLTQARLRSPESNPPLHVSVVPVPLFLGVLLQWDQIVNKAIALICNILNLSALLKICALASVSVNYGN